MNLYWVTTGDHAEDWFIVANIPEEACIFHEENEAYDPGNATAKMIMKIPKAITTDIGWPSEEVLHSCGANILLEGHTRVVEIGDRRFCEGLLESYSEWWTMTYLRHLEKAVRIRPTSQRNIQYRNS